MSKLIQTVPKLGESGVSFDQWKRGIKSILVLEKAFSAIDPGYVEVEEDGMERERVMKKEEVEKNDNAHALIMLTIADSLQPYGDDQPRARDFYLALAELFSGIGESRQEELREQLASFRIGDEKAAAFIGRAIAIWAEARVIKSNIAEGEVVGALLRAISTHHNPEFRLIGSIILTSPGGMGGRPSLADLGKRLMIVDKAADKEISSYREEAMSSGMHGLAAVGRGGNWHSGGRGGSPMARGGNMARGGGNIARGGGNMGSQGAGRGGGARELNLCFDFQAWGCHRGNWCRYSHECGECHQLGHGRWECPALALRRGGNSGQPQRAAAYVASFKENVKEEDYGFMAGLGL